MFFCLSCSLAVGIYSHTCPGFRRWRSPLRLNPRRTTMSYYPGYNLTIQREIAAALIEAARTCTAPNATSIVSEYTTGPVFRTSLTARRLRDLSPAYPDHVPHPHEDYQRIFRHLRDPRCTLPCYRPSPQLGRASRTKAVRFGNYHPEVDSENQSDTKQYRPRNSIPPLLCNWCFHLDIHV